jgi:hypothetical protein
MPGECRLTGKSAPTKNTCIHTIGSKMGQEMKKWDCVLYIHLVDSTVVEAENVEAADEIAWDILFERIRSNGDITKHTLLIEESKD